MALHEFAPGDREGVADGLNANFERLVLDLYPGLTTVMPPDYAPGTDYALDQLVRSLSGYVYVCIAPVTDAELDPALDSTHFRLYTFGSQPVQAGDTRLIAGGGIAWVGGYEYDVGAATYAINGPVYSSPATTVTLAASDPLLARIDVIVLTTDSTVEVIQGEASENPIKPDVDVATQLELSFVVVAANTLEPAVVSLDIYRNNVEWTTAGSGTINFASTTAPRTGSVSIEATNPVASNFLRFISPAPILLSDYNTLVLYIRSKAPWGTASLRLFWLNSANAQVGGSVTLVNGSSGFDSSNTTDYQLVVIPLASFGVGAAPVKNLRMRINAPLAGFFLDDLQLQGGILTPDAPDAGMQYRPGGWSASVAYQAQQVVHHLGFSHVALRDNVNSEPNIESANPDWRVLGSESPGGASFGSILVDGADPIIAEEPETALTIAASGGLALQTDAGTRTLMLAAPAMSRGAFFENQGSLIVAADAPVVLTPPMTLAGRVAVWTIQSTGPSTGSARFDVRKAPYSPSSIPGPGDSLTPAEGAKPVLVSAASAASADLAEWVSVDVDVGDVFAFVLEDCTNCTSISITLNIVAAAAA